MKKPLLVLALLSILMPVVQADLTGTLTQEVPTCQTLAAGVRCYDDGSSIECRAHTTNILVCQLTLGGESATWDGLDPADLRLQEFAAAAQAQLMRTIGNIGGAITNTVVWANDEASSYQAFLLASAHAFCNAAAEAWEDCDGPGETVLDWADFLVRHGPELLQRINRILVAAEEELFDLPDHTLVKADVQTYGVPGEFHVGDGDTCEDAQVSALSQINPDMDCNTRAEVSAEVDAHCSYVNEVLYGRPHCPGEWSRDWVQSFSAAGQKVTLPGGSTINKDTILRNNPSDDELTGDHTLQGSLDEFRAHLVRKDTVWYVETATGIFKCGSEPRYYPRPIIVESDTGFRALLASLHERLSDNPALDDSIDMMTGTVDATGGSCTVTGQTGSFVVDARNITGQGGAKVNAYGRFPCHIADQPTRLGFHAVADQDSLVPEVMIIDVDHLHLAGLTNPWSRLRCGA